MSKFIKPDNLNNVWASGGDRIYPGDTKYATGWQVEIPPRQYFNEIDYKQDQMLAHLNQHGIPVWDNETEYQADQSYVQGSTGTVYRCVLTHTNQNPDLDTSNTYWIIAFASAGDFYTAAQSDARYAQVANNGSDYNVATFRTNINVYSKAETYTKTEVDTKTTVASTAQAQALASNTTLLSPLRLAEAFKGENQLLSTTGYQKIPGGLTFVWNSAVATVPNAVGSSVTVNIPIPAAARLTSILTVQLTQDLETLNEAGEMSFGVSDKSTSSIQVIIKRNTGYNPGTELTRINLLVIGI